MTTTSIPCSRCHYQMGSDDITLQIDENRCGIHHEVVITRQYKYICPKCVYRQSWMSDPHILGYCQKCHEDALIKQQTLQRMEHDDYQFVVDMVCDKYGCCHEVHVIFREQSRNSLFIISGHSLSQDGQTVKIRLGREQIIQLYQQKHMEIPSHFFEDDSGSDGDLGCKLFG